MWNPQEYIDDLMALGYTKAEAVAETREYAALRQRVAAKERRKYAARAEENSGRPPIVLNLVNQHQRKQKET